MYRVVVKKTRYYWRVGSIWDVVNHGLGTILIIIMERKSNYRERCGLYTIIDPGSISENEDEVYIWNKN